MVEFALILPLLWALAVGAFDFGAAYVLKQKLTNAAREGARIGTNQTQTTPPSVQAIADAVYNYLKDAGVTTCTIDTTTPTPVTGAQTWTYSSTKGCASYPILVIERGYTFTATIGTPGVVTGTRVTLNYPFNWSFSSAIKLLAPSSSYAGAITISTNAVMQNLVGN
jgi:Flp pilus assembly protein TadG